MRTGDVRGAGTDANVYIQIFGKQGDTGRLPLRQSENTKNKFEKGRADMFTVEAVDIGKVSVRCRVYFRCNLSFNLGLVVQKTLTTRAFIQTLIVFISVGDGSYWS